MQRPKNWAFFTKDLDRTDQRRTWRYQRNHAHFEDLGGFATGQDDPAAEAACREFMQKCGSIVKRYRNAKGRTKRRLKQRLERQLQRDGFVEPAMV